MCSYISGNGNPEAELSYTSEGTSKALKTKNYYIFPKKLRRNFSKSTFG